MTPLNIDTLLHETLMIHRKTFTVKWTLVCRFYFSFGVGTIVVNSIYIHKFEIHNILLHTAYIIFPCIYRWAQINGYEIEKYNKFYIIFQSLNYYQLFSFSFKYSLTSMNIFFPILLQKWEAICRCIYVIKE